MKCPLIKGQVPLPNGVIADEPHECIREECAWWVKVSESCAMEAIPRIIGYLGNELKTIKEKMPYPPAPKH